MDRGLAGHVAAPGQLAGEVLAGFEAPAGDQLAIEVGETQLEQRERLGERGAVVDDRIDDQRTFEVRVAAHHQVAALDPGDVDPGWHLAAEGRAQLLEDRPVLVLAGHLVEVEPHVLERQQASGQQGQEAPQQALAPVGRRLFPAQLQRVVHHVDQRLLAHRAPGLAGKAWLQAFTRHWLDGVVVARRQVQRQRFIVAGAQAFFRVFVIAGVQRFAECGLVIGFGCAVYGRLVIDVQVKVTAQGRLGALAGCRVQLQLQGFRLQ
ncbi:hypothetical protein D3C76_1067580 [compost metagenome]